jgi:hypothetical protein
MGAVYFISKSKGAVDPKRLTITSIYFKTTLDSIRYKRLYWDSIRMPLKYRQIDCKQIR